MSTDSRQNTLIMMIAAVVTALVVSSAVGLYMTLRNGDLVYKMASRINQLEIAVNALGGEMLDIKSEDTAQDVSVNDIIDLQGQIDASEATKERINKLLGL